jgi:oligopeptidase A
MKALFIVRQLHQGLYDLRLHCLPKAPADIDAETAKAGKLLHLPYHTQPYTLVRFFGHLWSGGYAAGYYSYQWCNVLEADIWQYFEKHGILSPEVGRKFREEILSKGNSDEPEKLFKNFLGRGPKIGAYLKRLKP